MEAVLEAIDAWIEGVLPLPIPTRLSVVESQILSDTKKTRLILHIVSDELTMFQALIKITGYGTRVSEGACSVALK